MQIFLNESKKNSLYPHNFIAVLPSSNEYFGPQQFFGLEALFMMDYL